MKELRKNAEYLARLFSYACAYSGWISESIKQSPDEERLRRCVGRLAWNALYLLEKAYSPTAQSRTA